ncbi:/ gtaB / UTP--glucose-1-phosphate uridylyltransferase /:50616 Forward [Candidatus Hepatoplasma crinochetorum]|uniref:UTP--glucose-1-phosphate uridylyltransferase n=1 Tax=Candidatus Hepatoplasma crinochetorum TaxID=295596 RepID=A0A0G7ZNB7_9MOLU|nr:/ gtaB / UTP--glucose-1-phosphate uridylyltransferase /:50616 Forward [Candidatus Hepatoplasma crinochetorum]
MKHVKQKITKAVIPVAGLGTRFLPFTKTIPKEMLPILNIPSIEYIIKDAVNAGITDIIFVTSARKKALADYTDSYPWLENELSKKEKIEELSLIKYIPSIANYIFVRQSEQLGLGDAVLKAKYVVGNEPFALLLGDDILINDFKNINKNSVLKELVNFYQKYQSSIILVKKVEGKSIEKYGVVGFSKNISKKDFLLNSLIEKPSFKKAPSDLAIIGRYILKPEIFAYLEKEEMDPKTGEIQLTSAISKFLNDGNSVYAHLFEGSRYDMGNILGFLEAQIDFALNDKKYKKTFCEFLKNKIENIK